MKTPPFCRNLSIKKGCFPSRFRPGSFYLIQDSYSCSDEVCSLIPDVTCRHDVFPVFVLKDGRFLDRNVALSSVFFFEIHLFFCRMSLFRGLRFEARSILV